MRTRRCIAALFLIAGALRTATYTVTNANDTGAGSLRQAILDAAAGTDTIALNIPAADSGCDGLGICTIRAASRRPQHHGRLRRPQ
jgi:hypothetical protein